MQTTPPPSNPRDRRRHDAASRRRRVVVAVALAALSLIGLLGPASSPSVASARPAPAYSPQAAAKNLVNRDRVAHGLAPLKTHGQAQLKAQRWAERLAAEGRMYHSRLTDGITRRWCSLGENVGYAGSIARVETLYMRSPRHRAHILDPKWNGIGVGVAWRGSTVYVVHVFIKAC